MKKCLMKKIKHTILYCVFMRTLVMPYYYGSGTVLNTVTNPFPTFWQVTVPSSSGFGSTSKKLRFLRFRFRFRSHNTALWRALRNMIFFPFWGNHFDPPRYGATVQMYIHLKPNSSRRFWNIAINDGFSHINVFMKTSLHKYSSCCES